VILTFAGFSRSYYLKPLFGAPKQQRLLTSTASRLVCGFFFSLFRFCSLLAAGRIFIDAWGKPEQDWLQQWFCSVL
jgi:hypothetical protein